MQLRKWRSSVPTVIAISLIVTACGAQPSGDSQAPSETSAGESQAPRETSAGEGEALGAEYFQGESVRIIVPLGPGGGTDIAARLVGDLLGSQIPGEPTVIVENMEGAGGALGMQAAVNEPADCLTLVVITAGVKSRWLLGSEGHDYPLDQFHGIAGFGGGTVVTAALAEVASTTDELAALSEPFVTGHTFPDGTGALVEKITAELLPYPIQQVFGYDGYGEVALAVQRGELEGSSPTEGPWRENFQPLEDEGLDLALLFQHGIATPDGEIGRSTLFEEVPTFLEEYERINGEPVPEGLLLDVYRTLAELNTSSFTFLVNPDSSDSCVATMRNAFDAAVGSAEWQSRAEETFGEVPILIPGDEAGLDRLQDVPQEVRDWIVENGQGE